MDIALSKCLPIVKLVAIKSETLVTTDLSLDIVNGVRRLHLKSDRLASGSLHKNLHGTVKVQGG